jgi:RNA polymerase-binding transcription factor DksA
VEDGAQARGPMIGQISNPVRGTDTRSIPRATRARATSGARRGMRQRIEAMGERGAIIALALRRLEREHVALLLAICELEDPTGAQESPAMREALLVLLRDDFNGVQHALLLAAQGRYGVCEDCQRPIARRELELHPAATHCAVCKTQSAEDSWRLKSRLEACGHEVRLRGLGYGRRGRGTPAAIIHR